MSQWYLHVRAFIDTNLAYLDSDTITPEANIAAGETLIFREFENFFLFYRECLPQNPARETAKADCVLFQQRKFYDFLVRILDHVYSSQLGDIISRNKVSLSLLEKSLTRNRTLFEELSSNPEFESSTLPYDEHPFRCPQVLCFYFHEGFRSAAARKNHVNHHDLPFQCLVENCSSHALGFRSKSTLLSHMTKIHPEECDLDDSFSSLSRMKVKRTKWHCESCDQFFALKRTLDDHIMAHAGEKPHCCSECGKGFTRKSDMKRHEKIHEKRRR